MQPDTISLQIKAFIEKQFPIARTRAIGPELHLLENGIVDSLGVLDLVTFLESEFQIVVADEELVPENFQSVRCLTAFVESKTASAHRSAA